jgi:putative DNA-invertase from lambdoid prophage Rac
MKNLIVKSLKTRGVKLHLQDLSGDIAGNGLSKLFLSIAAAFAEAERDHIRIRERMGQVKADQKARGRYLGGKVPFGFRRGDNGELVPHEAEQEAIREMVALRAQGRSLRVVAVTGRGGRSKGSVFGEDPQPGCVRTPTICRQDSAG